jgi:hypothetical protein
MERTASNLRRSGEKYFIQIQGFWWNVLLSTSTFFPEVEGRTFLHNIGIFLPNLAAPYVIRRNIYS